MLDRVNEDRGLLLAILTVSDRSARGERADLTGPELKNFVTQRGGEVVAMAIVSDEKEAIRQKLIEWCDGQDSPEIILTTGGTGLSPRDVTPEATLEVIEKEVPGLAEAMRAESLKKTPMAMLSRAVCGLRKQTLIINLPGSVRGALENLEAVWPALGHAVEILRQKISDCQQSAHSHFKDKT
ncbi:MAG TPA: MogA/MoaB family molybdenum cofactor biosynthesis protein [Candidatus Saccharicenans sp.]|jgi:molybdenum cofactor synthesis domain-containing protein|nr:MogA/MoaB family molybdenum cofactor biosynthesis protein [Candidatus Saccharicenans sp.]HQO76800.1 MogA/MoaB family molybdenum cofactor biosynthesis protein [Candidatus Saccharicenans sp.]HUM80119.1 MogA/MoaB family molybdenum cofactor biosynthesis protein [Candidatus Saccharicenans sp.]